MKNDITLSLSAILLCLFWYGIFVFAHQVLAIFLSVVCGILAIVNLSYLLADAAIFIKYKVVHSTESLKRKNLIEKLIHIKH
jgi:hypothetical protein